MSCGSCQADDEHRTAPVAVILLFAPGLQRPYPLIPAEDYCVCGKCDSVFVLVDKASNSHPLTRTAGPWTRAVIVFVDGHGIDLRAKRTALPTATA